MQQALVATAFEKFFSFGCCLGFDGRTGLSRRGEFLSFASPKERNQRKGDPAAPDPSLRYGPPPVRAPDGPAANSPACRRLKQRVWLVPSAAVRGRRGQKGWGAFFGALGLKRALLWLVGFEAKLGSSAYAVSIGSYQNRKELCKQKANSQAGFGAGNDHGSAP